METKRECGSCTKCCEGWLHGEAHGHKFYRGKPCHFKMNGGCSIYENRPDDPCKSYKCQWLIDEKIPYWMKPNEINAIINLKEKDEIKYFQVVEAGEKLRVEVLNWLFIFALTKNINLQYYIEGAMNYVGGPKFLKLMEGETEKNTTGAI